MQENRTKLKKKRGFFEVFTDSESDATKARRLMNALMSKHADYEIYMRTSDSVLAIKQGKNISIRISVTSG